MFAIFFFVCLILYGTFALFSILAIGRMARFCVFTVWTERILQIICAAVFVLVPTWDIIPSRLYFHYLCKQEGGVRVLKTVDIDKAYFKRDGHPDDKQLLQQYAQFSRHDRNFSSWAHITKIEGGIQDKETNELLGTVTDFVYYGGWLGSRIDPMSPMTCPNFPNYIVHDLVLQAVFKKK
jgi:hypothetical protein